MAKLRAAEIEKTAYLTHKAIHFQWWPKLPTIPGWISDDQASTDMHMNIWLPKGQKWENSPSVIYGRALWMKDMGKGMTLDGFIAYDLAGFKHAWPHLGVTKLPPMKTANGLSMRTYLFDYDTTKDSTHEKTAYGVEKSSGEKYIIVLVLSCKTKAAFDRDVPVFDRVVTSYK